MTTLKQVSSAAVSTAITAATSATTHYIFKNRISIANFISNYVTQANSIPIIGCVALAIPMIYTQYYLDRKLGSSRTSTLMYYLCTTALVGATEFALSYKYFNTTIADYETKSTYNAANEISNAVKRYKIDTTSKYMTQLLPFNYSLVLSSALLLIAGYARLFYNAFKLKKQLATQSQANETAIQLAVAEAHASRIALADKAIAGVADQVGEEAAAKLHNSLVAATPSEIDAASPASTRRFRSKWRPQGAPTSAAAGAAAAPARAQATPAGADTSGATNLGGPFTRATPMVFSPSFGATSPSPGFFGNTTPIAPMTPHEQAQQHKIQQLFNELLTAKTECTDLTVQNQRLTRELDEKKSKLAEQTAQIAQLNTQLGNEQTQTAATIDQLRKDIARLEDEVKTAKGTSQTKRKRAGADGAPKAQRARKAIESDGQSVTDTDTVADGGHKDKRRREAESDAESTTTTERPASGDAAKEPTRKSGRKVIRPSILSPDANRVRDFVLARSQREAKQAAAAEARAKAQAEMTDSDSVITSSTRSSTDTHTSAVDRRRANPSTQSTGSQQSR